MTLGSCRICSESHLARFVAQRAAEGRTPHAIEKLSQQSETVSNMKAERIAKHLREHAGPTPITRTAVIGTSYAQQDSDDVAVLVQRKVVQNLKDDTARVTVQHGLQAQQLLDRRAERAKDRELAVTIARMLHTSAPPTDLIEARPDIVIEGEVTRVG